MKTKNIYISLIALFLLVALIAGGVFVYQHQDGKASEQAFNELEQMIAEPTESGAPENTDEIEVPDDEPAPVSGEEDAEIAEALAAYEKYKALYEQNEDFIGWITIANTKVNYPVMQSVDNPDFYLKHGFDKSYSNYGVPYADEACAIGLSNNIVIYGHNMKNGSMFSDLLQYASEDFCAENPVICFDTLSRLNEYQVIAAFCFDTNNETFRYNEYVDMNEEAFAEFMENCNARKLYDTGVSAEYGDELITLSTCEYTYENGRFVVVAKRVTE